MQETNLGYKQRFDSIITNEVAIMQGSQKKNNSKYKKMIDMNSDFKG